MIKRHLQNVNIKTKFLVFGFIGFVLIGFLIYATREDSTRNTTSQRQPQQSQDLQFRSNIVISEEKQDDYTEFQQKEAKLVKQSVQLPNGAYLPPDWFLAAEKKSEFITSYVYTSKTINKDQYPTVSIFFDTFPGNDEITLEDFSITRREQLDKYNFSPIPPFPGTIEPHLAFETTFEGENGVHHVFLVVTVKDNVGVSFLVDSLEKDKGVVEDEFGAILASYLNKK